MSRNICREVAFRLVVSAAALGAPTTVLADGHDGKGRRLQAEPFVFVGNAEECGGSAGNNLVTSAWLGGMGLPDGDRDTRLGLLLSKNGPTANCSAAGAEIRGVSGTVVTADFDLGFDYRNGGHCGGGAPRFNVSYTLPSGGDGFSFVGGCANDLTSTAAPQDPAQWSRVRFQTSNPAESFPVIPPGSTIERITLILDEGTDIPTGPHLSGDLGNPSGIGLAVVDNIAIGAELIERGNGIAPKPGDLGRDDD
jgi:hypothetical protein